MISRLLRNADGLYHRCAPDYFDAEGVNGTANAIYVPRAMNYSSMAEQRSITLSNSPAVDNIQGRIRKLRSALWISGMRRRTTGLIYIDWHLTR